MSKLEPPNIHYLSSAIGWLELGNLAEAKAELEQVEPGLRQHPDVLEARWLISAEERDWDAGLQIAKDLIGQAPERPSGWLHQAYALRRANAGGLDQAWRALLPAAEMFPKEPTVAYNLSCYACQMGDLVSARAWFKRASRLGDKEQIKSMALGDPDLQTLWDEIREM